MRSGLFIAEGSSDAPLPGIVTELFAAHGIEVRLTAPDFALLEQQVRRDVASRVTAACQLMADRPMVIVVHRDVDNSSRAQRLREIEDGLDLAAYGGISVPVLPVRMTEAWLLLDEPAIRRVAGKPNGRDPLGLPLVHEIEQQADPKACLREALRAAADLRGRRRERLDRRFSDHRRQLLERLDVNGPVTHLNSWKALVLSVAEAAGRLQD